MAEDLEANVVTPSPAPPAVAAPTAAAVPDGRRGDHAGRPAHPGHRHRGHRIEGLGARRPWGHGGRSGRGEDDLSVLTDEAGRRPGGPGGPAAPGRPGVGRFPGDGPQRIGAVGSALPDRSRSGHQGRRGPGEAVGPLRSGRRARRSGWGSRPRWPTTPTFRAPPWWTGRDSSSSSPWGPAWARPCSTTDASCPISSSPTTLSARVRPTTSNWGTSPARRWGTRAGTSGSGKAVDTLRGLAFFDHCYIGGGNAKHLTGDLAPDVSTVDNTAGILGGIKLWGSRQLPV